MKTRPIDPERDFAQLAAWFTIMEDEASTESSLREYYGLAKERLIIRAAENEHGTLGGFSWAARDPMNPAKYYFSLFVRPEERRQGIGNRLYEETMQAVKDARGKEIEASIKDTCPEGLAFAQRCGFSERAHRLGMELDLGTFDDRPYEEVIARLKGEGFLFTSMAELGNTEEAQRRLYELNDATGMEIPGSDGEHSWASFEDFQKRVCQSDWYMPAGQMVVIDTNTSTWAAMSAITRLEGVAFAYNLHTGVDRGYRGRKLGLAVKVTALRFAREVLQVRLVRTHNNAINLPMISINRKLGYHQIPGFFVMQKKLT